MCCRSQVRALQSSARRGDLTPVGTCDDVTFITTTPRALPHHTAQGTEARPRERVSKLLARLDRVCIALRLTRSPSPLLFLLGRELCEIIAAHRLPLDNRRKLWRPCPVSVARGPVRDNGTQSFRIGSGGKSARDMQRAPLALLGEDLLQPSAPLCEVTRTRRAHVTDTVYRVEGEHDTTSNMFRAVAEVTPLRMEPPHNGRVGGVEFQVGPEPREAAQCALR